MWFALAFLILAYVAHQDLGFDRGAGADDFFNRWVDVVVLWASAGACLGGALRARRSRAAWLFVTAGLASWAIGDTIWSVRFGHASVTPVTSISDVFWLAWYPVIIIGLALLVRDRVPRFELHRWIDGVVVMLLVATPWVALLLEPISEQSHASTLAHVVQFTYPLADAAVVGGTLGVYALMGWRPGRMWIVLGLGLAMMGVADAAYAAQVLVHSYDQSRVYDAVWLGGAVLVAFAAWEPHPGELEPREVTGWRAIALPLAAQVLAVGIQVYGFFHEIPRVERMLTVVVLLIAIVQIVVTRPRSLPGSSGRPLPPRARLVELRARRRARFADPSGRS